GHGLEHHSSATSPTSAASSTSSTSSASATAAFGLLLDPVLGRLWPAESRWRLRLAADDEYVGSAPGQPGGKSQRARRPVRGAVVERGDRILLGEVDRQAQPGDRQRERDDQSDP